MKSIEDELRDGGTVLVADPSENENDEASCRAVLRTLHMALHPKLRDPIPPLPIKRADGAFGMTLRAPPSRVPAAPFWPVCFVSSLVRVLPSAAAAARHPGRIPAGHVLSGHWLGG